ncbi:unnamed protein product [Sphagnum balticum]
MQRSCGCKIAAARKFYLQEQCREQASPQASSTPQAPLLLRYQNSGCSTVFGISSSSSSSSSSGGTQKDPRERKETSLLRLSGS